MRRLGFEDRRSTTARTPGGSPRARARVLAACLVAALAAGRSALPATGSKPAQPRRNLVLLTLDTTRADHLGAWGHPFARTPHLDALADRGVRFAHCDTAAPITLPSHATILSGLFPPRHGVRDNGSFRLKGEVTTVAERLSDAGYDTAAIVSAIVLARRHGLDQGFKSYDDDLETGYAAGTEVEERTAERTTAAAVSRLASLKPPFFLWVHYYDPHEEYRPPSRFADAAKGPNRLYDGEIAYMDEQIGVLLGKLPKDTDVIVVGDHGQMLGEHGEATHGLLLYQAARRVPLILAGPDIPKLPARRCLARTADVAPTLLALAEIQVPAGLDGASLWPLPPRESCDRTSYTESFLPFFAYKWYPLRGLANDRYFYLHGPTPSLYDLRSAAGEARDLAPVQPKVAADWGGRMEKAVRAMGEAIDGAFQPSASLSGEEQKQLAALGYLSGGAGGTVDRELPDPRKMTDVATYLHQAAEDVQQGRCKEALPKLLDITRRDKHNFPALNLSGLCLKEAGRLDEALGAFRRAARENELSALPVANIAGCLLALGKKSDAEREYRHALTLDASQSESAANLARLLRESGRRGEALKVLSAARAQGAHSPDVALELGLAQAEGGDFAAALASFRETARRDPTNPVPLDNAARAAYRLGRTRESAQLYEQLVRIAPSRVDAWKTLGAIYLYELGAKQDADRCFRRALTLEVDPAERQRLEEALQEIGG